MAGPSEGPLELTIKWGKEMVEVEVARDATVADLKDRIHQLTHVRIDRQRILGLKGMKVADEARLSEVLPSTAKPLVLIGTAESEIAALQQQAEAPPPEFVDDLATDFDTADVELGDRPEVVEKLQRRISSAVIKSLHPPRAGKKCLVLDIDYTLFDLGSPAESAAQLARPHLHEFLGAAYPHYDIVIWSATSMKWVEVKMRELGCLDHPDYKLTAFMDHLSMLTLQHEKYGKQQRVEMCVFNCKPLQVLWGRFPEFYHAANTIMMDDLRRNYVLNKQQGLVIRPWRKHHRNRDKDRELVYLARYLDRIAELDSLEGLDHDRWEEYAGVGRKRKANGGDGAAP